MSMDDYFYLLNLPDQIVKHFCHTVVNFVFPDANDRTTAAPMADVQEMKHRTCNRNRPKSLL